jgi:hypothetical protein
MDEKMKPEDLAEAIVSACTQYADDADKLGRDSTTFSREIVYALQSSLLAILRLAYAPEDRVKMLDFVIYALIKMKQEWDLGIDNE